MKIGVLESEMPRGCWRLDPIKTGQMCFFHTGTQGFNLFSDVFCVHPIYNNWLEQIKHNPGKQLERKHNLNTVV